MKEGLDNKSESDTAIKTFEHVKSGDKITWSDPVMTEPTRNMVTRLGQVIRLSDRLTYTLAVKLRYPGIMADLDQLELTVIYMSIRHMEFSLVEAGVGGGIKHTKELRVLNFKKAMKTPDANEWCKEIRKEKE